MHERHRRAAKSDAAPAAAGPQVLIVDDEIFVAWHLEAMIRAMSLEVCGVAAKGCEAVRLAAEHKPGLVLMDVNLHDRIDGIEVARRIRALSPVPIIFVTAYSDDETRGRIAAAIPGAIVLAKPIGEAQLRSAVRAALARPSA